LKDVQIISYARKGKYHPQKPDDDTCQMIIDVSLLQETPINGLDESDTTKTVDEHIVKANEEFFQSQKSFLKVQIDNFLKSSYDILKIFYVCHDGLVRSRVTADYFEKWLAVHYFEKFYLSVTHIDIDNC
jgi:hypothetical protein